MSPTSMKYRNLMTMDTKEAVRTQPVDSVVLMGECDKTAPAQPMGVTSADVPAVQLVAGPMMTARHGGVRPNACTDCRRHWAQHRAGKIDQEEIDQIEERLATTAGTCAVMGTASTMACIAETSGSTCPDRRRSRRCMPTGCAPRRRQARWLRGSRPSWSARSAGHIGIRRQRPAHPARVQEIAQRGHPPDGHRRAGVRLPLERLSELSETTPVLVNLKPTGEHYMEDFFRADGMGAVLRELRPPLHLECPTVTGETLGQRLNREVTTAVDRGVIAARATDRAQGQLGRPVRVARAARRAAQAIARQLAPRLVADRETGEAHRATGPVPKCATLDTRWPRETTPGREERLGNPSPRGGLLPSADQARPQETRH